MTNGTNQGLFVIVAVVIFGIFVGLSYLIFNSQMKTGLSTVFCESFNFVSTQTGLIEYRECVPPIEVTTENGKNTFKGKDFTNNKELKDVEFKTSNVSGGVSLSPKTDTYTGTLTDFEVPDLVNGKKVVSLSGFKDYKFKGTFKKPKYVTRIETDAFWYANFKGDLDLTGVTYVGNGAFALSKFDGTFTGDDLTFIGKSAFDSSRFVGDFKANNVTEIGEKAFNNSKFDGTFEAKKLKIIRPYAFYSSLFTGGFDVNDINKIGEKSFYNSLFNGYFINSTSLTEIGEATFYNSLFVGDFNSKNLTIIQEDTFNKSKFNGMFITGSKLNTISFGAFRESPFIGSFDSNNIRYLKNGCFKNSNFSSYYLSRNIGGDYSSYFGNNMNYKNISYK